MRYILLLFTLALSSLTFSQANLDELTKGNCVLILQLSESEYETKKEQVVNDLSKLGIMVGATFNLGDDKKEWKSRIDLIKKEVKEKKFDYRLDFDFAVEKGSSKELVVAVIMKIKQGKIFKQPKVQDLTMLNGEYEDLLNELGRKVHDPTKEFIGYKSPYKGTNHTF